MKAQARPCLEQVIIIPNSHIVYKKKMDKIHPDVLGRHFMAHMIATHESELRASRGDRVNIQEVVVALLSQYEDLSFTDVDPANPKPEVAKLLSEYTDVQLFEKSKAVLTLGLEDDHKFVEFVTRTYIPERIRLDPLDRLLRGLPRRKLAKGMTAEAMFGINAERMDCALCIRVVELGTEVLELPCRHWFHPDCFRNWLRECRKCPVCCKEAARGARRMVITEQKLTPSREQKLASDLRRAKGRWID